VNERAVSTILLIGVEPELSSLIENRVDSDHAKVRIYADRQQALEWLERRVEHRYTVVIGTSIDQPVRLAQRIHKLVDEATIVILSDHDDFPHVSRALQFTPFLGDHIVCHLNKDTAAVVRTLQESVVKDERLQRFRSTLDAMNQQLQTISTYRVSAIQYLDQVLDYAPVGILALDPDGRVISCNQRAETILEQSERRIIGTPLAQLFSEECADTLSAQIARAKQDDTQPASSVLTLWTALEEERFVSVLVTSLPVGPNAYGSLAILQDVTVQIVSDREREAALQFRDEFLSLAAHELKTPLTSIKGFADLIGRQIQMHEWDRERIIRFHNRLQVQLSRLEFLITDLLDVSRIRQGRLVLRPAYTDLGELAENVASRFLDSPGDTTQHRIEFEVPYPVHGYWDSDRLDQVVTNLLSNAIKYSPDGGQVLISVYQEDERAVLSIRDEGVGIEPEVQGRLFQPFTRGEPLSDVPGTGLGLHISASIVEQHRGEILVDSVPGEGSRFTIYLPIEALVSRSQDSPVSTRVDVH
jgi:PAS domain S-box-containing protein